jgi:hypothetical protein
MNDAPALSAREQEPAAVAPPKSASGSTWPAERDPFQRRVTTAPAPLPSSAASSFSSRTLGQSILPALMLPVRGEGWQWLVAGGILSPMATFLATAMVLSGGGGIRALFMTLISSAIALTINARFFQACLAASSLESDDPGPLPDLQDWRVEFLLPGLGFAMWLLTMVIPGQVLGAMDSDFLHRAGIVLTLLLPALTWVPGLLVYSVTGSVGGLLNPKTLAGLLKAKPQLWLMLYGSGALAVVVALGVAFLAGLVLPWLWVLVAGVCIPYAHGVIGAMTGRALHEHPDLVELAGYDRPEV